jgi:uncharacterized RmlC-like cupin family protein
MEVSPCRMKPSGVGSEVIFTILLDSLSPAGACSLMSQNQDLLAAVEGEDGITVLRDDRLTRAWNGIRYRTGLSARNTGARALSMNVATIPPGGVAFAHIHVGFEVMLYILEGSVRHEYGPNLEHRVDNRAGDLIFIEPGVPHEVLNRSDTDPVVAVVARSDASEWEHIVEFPSRRRPDRTSGPRGSP